MVKDGCFDLLNSAMCYSSATMRNGGTAEKAEEAEKAEKAKSFCYMPLNAFAKIASAFKENGCTDYCLDDVFFDLSYASLDAI